MERQVHIKLSERKHGLLLEMAHAREESVSTLVRRAIDRLLEEHRRMPPTVGPPDEPPAGR